MQSIIKFIKEKTALSLLIVFILGNLSGLVFIGFMNSVRSNKPSLAVLSPKQEEKLSGVVPIRVYYKTHENAFLLSADYKIDEGETQNLPVTRINDQEIAIVGAWDSTLNPGNHTLTISLYKVLKTGQRSLVAQTKLPVAVLLFQ